MTVIDPDPQPVPSPRLHGCYWDDVARTVTCYGEDGQPQVRPYNASENENADRAIAAARDAQTEAAISQALADALAALQAIIDDTNANINTNPAARIKDLSRVLRRVIRLQTRRFDGTT